MLHELKIDDQRFQELWEEIKTHEVRKNDIKDWSEEERILEELDEISEDDSEEAVCNKLFSISGLDDVGCYIQHEYTYHIIWCLYAIVWGIQQYDKLKGTHESAK